MPETSFARAPLSRHSHINSYVLHVTLEQVHHRQWIETEVDINAGQASDKA